MVHVCCGVGPLVKKPVNNFSEDELYPRKTTPVHNPPFPLLAATSPLTHKHSLAPPFSPSADIRPTRSLPVHLTSTVSPHEADREKGVVAGNETGSSSEPLCDSHDQNDGPVSDSLPQSVSEATPPDTRASDLTHRRNNSDFFVTPTSSPPASPRLSSHIAPVPARVGDRISSSREERVTERLLETFFSRAPKKFEDLVLIENDQIPTANFLECCEAVVPFFGKLGVFCDYMIVIIDTLSTRHTERNSICPGEGRHQRQHHSECG